MEIWKPIAGYEGLYEVSSNGRIKSLKRNVPAGPGKIGFWTVNERILRPRVQRSGHLVVVLSRKNQIQSRLVHQLVLEAFVGPRPDGMECCHGDATPGNNKVENLRWGTRLENARDMVLHGHSVRGSKSKHAIIDEMQAISIRRLINICGWKSKEVAALYGISRRGVGFIKEQRNWRWLEEATWIQGV